MVIHYVGHCAAELFLSLLKVPCAMRTPVFKSDSCHRKQISFFQTFLLSIFFKNYKTSPLFIYRNAIHIFHSSQHPFIHTKLILGGINWTLFMQNATECEELNWSHCNLHMDCRRDLLSTSHWLLVDRVSYCCERASVQFFFCFCFFWRQPVYYSLCSNNQVLPKGG